MEQSDEKIPRARGLSDLVEEENAIETVRLDDYPKEEVSNGYDQRWNCFTCGKVNYEWWCQFTRQDEICFCCQTPRFTEMPEKGIGPRVVQCPLCTLRNSASQKTCLACKTPLGRLGVVPPPIDGIYPRTKTVPEDCVEEQRRSSASAAAAEEEEGKGSRFKKPHSRAPNILGSQRLKPIRSLPIVDDVPRERSTDDIYSLAAYNRHSGRTIDHEHSFTPKATTPEGDKSVECLICTLVNPPRSVYCQACSSRLPLGPYHPYTGNDWEKERAKIRKQQEVRFGTRSIDTKPLDPATKHWGTLACAYFEENQRVSARIALFEKETLVDICMQVIEDHFTSAQECMDLLSEIIRVTFDHEKLVTHCIDVIARNFSTYVYDLQTNPRLSFVVSKLRKEGATATETMHNKSGKTHLIKSLFQSFVDFPQMVQTRIVWTVWKNLHFLTERTQTELSNTRSTHKDFAKKRKSFINLNDEKMRLFEFCLWQGMDEEMVPCVLSDGIYPFDSGLMVPIGDPAIQKQMEEAQVKNRISEDLTVSLLSSSTAPWLYFNATKANLSLVMRHMESYIKKNWLSVIDCASWNIVPVEQRKMIEADYQSEMLKYYEETPIVPIEEPLLEETDMIEDDFMWNDSSGGEWPEEWEDEIDDWDSQEVAV